MKQNKGIENLGRRSFNLFNSVTNVDFCQKSNSKIIFFLYRYKIINPWIADIPFPIEEMVIFLLNCFNVN